MASFAVEMATGRKSGSVAVKHGFLLLNIFIACMHFSLKKGV